jgi:hypothetical protein
MMEVRQLDVPVDVGMTHLLIATSNVSSRICRSMIAGCARLEHSLANRKVIASMVACFFFTVKVENQENYKCPTLQPLA